MPSLKIAQVGAPVLRQQARKLTKKEILSSKIQQRIALMRETMREAPGVGLAAPQIGESLQLVVIEDREEYMHKFSAKQLADRERSPVPFQVIINPKLFAVETTTVEFYEGCLSFDGFVGLVPRLSAVKVECLNQCAEPTTIHAQGWFARILQHEIDHLHGKLCIDHMQLNSLTTLDNYIKYYHPAALPKC